MGCTSSSGQPAAAPASSEAAEPTVAATQGGDKKWTLKKQWEVSADQGWLPWAPGADLTGYDGKLLKCTMGSVSYGILFKSAKEGFQINLETGKFRKLRAADTADSQSKVPNSGFLTESEMQVLMGAGGGLELLVAPDSSIGEAMMDGGAEAVQAIGGVISDVVDFVIG